MKTFFLTYSREKINRVYKKGNSLLILIKINIFIFLMLVQKKILLKRVINKLKFEGISIYLHRFHYVWSTLFTTKGYIV